ncbi:glycosyl transferase group 1 [Kribbella flavida DSM 17836]|uniref:Glycosyl transferase group 1 n=1 Tax=Kribbella flavida (strain DSM 17836 / JCM 10339 / NBRC 14399) TaxID=479435 RepID=D2PXE7_KRIFD|nr:glycosyltransferase [Kribbella flavida]ADB29795.1 glycosyl transferase group 1 [Kribbella flavida DSM 17836]
MRIAMVSEHASPLAVLATGLGTADAGGQNVHVAALASALAARGHSVEVYTRRDDPALPERMTLGDGVEVVHVPAGPAEQLPKDELLPYMAEFGDWMAERWAAAPPDVLHAHFWMSGVACTRARRTVSVPFAQTFHALGVVKRRHQGAQDTSPAERLDLEAGLARQADAVIATATDEVRELLALGAPAQTMHVVPCGVDPALFVDESPAPEDWWQGRGGRVLSLSRLVERKGVDTVIAALANVPDAELVIAGGPAGAAFDQDPEVRRLRAEAERHGVADRVRLLGAVERDLVPRLLRSADVVACTPWYEPFGIVPLEAMAAGRPVVGSAVGGLLDTIVDGVTGVHVPPRDPERLAAVLRDLLADPERRAALGAAGAARVAERYTWARVAEETETVYARMTSALSAGRGR